MTIVSATGNLPTNETPESLLQELIEKLRPWEKRAFDTYSDRHKTTAYRTKTNQVRGVIWAVETQVSALKVNTWNCNGLRQRQEEALQESLDHFGQFAQLTVRPHPKKRNTLEIIDGEHRYHRLDENVVVNILLGFTTNELKKLSLISNSHGDNDPKKLGELLSSLDESLGQQELMRGLPIDQQDLEDILAIAQEEREYGERQPLSFKQEFNYDEDDLPDDAELESGDTFRVFEVKIPIDYMADVERALSAIKDAENLDGVEDRSEVWGRAFIALSNHYLMHYLSGTLDRLEQAPETVDIDSEVVERY